MGQSIDSLEVEVIYADKAVTSITREMLHEEVELPETLGREVALQLLEEVQKGSYVCVCVCVYRLYGAFAGKVMN